MGKKNLLKLIFSVENSPPSIHTPGHVTAQSLAEFTSAY